MTTSKRNAGPGATNRGTRVARTPTAFNADLLILVSEERRFDLPVTGGEGHRTGEVRLRFHLKTENPGLGVFFSKYHSRVFRQDPVFVAEGVFQDFQKLRQRDPRNDTELVAGVGVQLSELLLPSDLRRTLWELRDAVDSVHIVSDEAWIPWELLKLKDPDSGTLGPFLVETFAITRWFAGVPDNTHLPLRELAWVMPRDLEGSEELSATGAIGGTTARRGESESALFEMLNDERHRATRVRARLADVLQALASGRYDGFHFVGHGLVNKGDPNRWSLQLENWERLTPPLIGNLTPGLASSHPLVFLNSCHSGRAAFNLSDLGGWAPAFVDAGAGAFVGAYWAILSDRSRLFARVFYRSLVAGHSLGEAVRAARLRLREEFPGDPTWLAYTVFGNPLASIAPAGSSGGRRIGLPLSLHENQWRADRSSPAALLRAEYGVVPFHGREDERDDLRRWCTEQAAVKVRLYTGAGGMGKTRLALQICQEMHRAGWWAGFLDTETLSSPLAAITRLLTGSSPVVVVIDYAETRREVLVPLLRQLYATNLKGPFRLILLARSREEWWEELKTEGHGVGQLIAGPATSHLALGPLAMTLAERKESYSAAASAFASVLGKPLPEMASRNLEGAHLRIALVLHMSALAAVEGVELEDEQSILDYVLDRERRYWKRLAQEHELPVELLRGIGRAVTAISLGGGCPTEADTIAVLKHLKHFADQRNATLATVARLLHEAYAGVDIWVDPLRPDILHEHLAEQEFAHDPDELYWLLLDRGRGLKARELEGE